MKGYYVQSIAREAVEPKFDINNIKKLTAEAVENINNPFVIDNMSYALVRVDECSLNEIIVLDEAFVIVEHGAFAHACKADSKADMRAYQHAMLNRLVFSGIVIENELYSFHTSSAADLKVGKSRFIKESVRREKAKELMFFRNKENMTKWSANEECKVKATLLSGSELVQGGINIKDVCIVPSIEFDTFFGDTLSLENNASMKILKGHKEHQTHFDGFMLIISDDVELPVAGQGRIGNLKLTWVKVSIEWLKGRAISLGKEIPNYITDKWDNQRNINTVKAICTEDVVKGLGWFESFEDLCNTLNKMGVGNLRACRVAEESVAEKRNLSRQALQELFVATNDELKQLSSLSTNFLKKARTIERQLEILREKKDYSGLIYAAYPDIFANPDVYEFRRQSWRNEFAHRMVSPKIANSHYEQIAEDPVAFVDIVFFGIEPENAGVLKAGECFCSAKHGAKVYGVRHPANLINARIMKNNKNMWLKFLGGVNVFVVPVNDPTLSGYWDGDVDGDECFWSTDETLVSVTERLIDLVKPMPFVFPHDKAKKGPYPETRKDWATAMAELLFNGVEYNLVGRYSNLATKILVNLGKEKVIGKAAYAHAMSILCLDFVKTGVLPELIMQETDKLIREYRYMPYNQRYMKHKTLPYDDPDWDEPASKFCTAPKGDNVVDRYGDIVLNAIGGDSFDCDVSELNYKPEMLIYGERRPLKAVKTTEEFTKINQIAAKPVKKYVTLLELLYACKIVIQKSELLNNKDYEREAIEMCRRAIMNFVKAQIDVDDKTALRIVANNLWKYYINQTISHDFSRHANKAEHVNFLFKMFGDVYAENVYMNMAPDNSPEPVSVEEKKDDAKADTKIASKPTAASEPDIEQLLASLPENPTQEDFNRICRAGNPQ